MRLNLTAISLAAFACAAGARAEQEFDGVAAMEYVETQVAFGPRVPNSAGHRAAGDWIVERLRATADSVAEQAFIHITRDGDSLRLRNLIGRFRPDAVDRILYVAHWDTRPRADQSANLGEQRVPVPGANDGASGTALLLGVADALAVRPPTFGVDLLFVDGEDYGDFGRDVDVFIGSRYYAGQLSPDERKPLFAVVWDMVGDRDLRIPQEPNSVEGAPEVVRRVWSAAAALGYGRIFVNSLGTAINDDHLPLLAAGIRAIDVIDFSYPHWHTVEDTPDKVSAESLQIVGDVAMALLR